jgi:hypothetical protein
VAINLPTLIKSTKSNTIWLADARRFWSINEPYRLIVGEYKQIANMKSFKIIREFLITPVEHQKLLGTVSFQEVSDFHDQILTFGIGQHKIARASAKKLKSSLKSRSIVQLNPKIDSVDQRRLQCSVAMNALIKNIATQTKYAETDTYRGVAVSIDIQSSARQFGKVDAKH